jgi:hypothetical protein
LHAGWRRLYTNTHNRMKISLFHCNNGFANEPHCWVIRALPVLLWLQANENSCSLAAFIVPLLSHSTITISHTCVLQVEVICHHHFIFPMSHLQRSSFVNCTYGDFMHVYVHILLWTKWCKIIHTSKWFFLNTIYFVRKCFVQILLLAFNVWVSSHCLSHLTQYWISNSIQEFTPHYI